MLTLLAFEASKDKKSKKSKAALSVLQLKVPTARTHLTKNRRKACGPECDCEYKPQT